MESARKHRWKSAVLAVAALVAFAGSAEANGRSPQVRLGDIPVDLTCHAPDGQAVGIGNARISDRREVEVRDGVATLFIPLGNIEAIEIETADEGQPFVRAFLRYTDGDSLAAELRVASDAGEPLVASGMVPGKAAIQVDVMRCRLIEISAAGSISVTRPARGPTRETAN
jgi:hypothetical protein